MNFNELCQAVIINTNREDLINETKLAVFRAIRSLHGMAYFPRDRATTQLFLGNASGVNPSVDLMQVFNGRLRRLESVQVIASDGQSLSPNLPTINTADLFNKEAMAVRYGKYQAGNTLNIKYPEPVSNLYVVWYKFPGATENDFDSWIADNYPDAVINSATAGILAMLGNKGAGYFQGLLGNIQVGNIHEIMVDNISDEPDLP